MSANPADDKTPMERVWILHDEQDCGFALADAEKRVLIVPNENEKQRAFISSVRAQARAVEVKDGYAAGHCERVERYAEIVAQHYRTFDADWLFTLRVGAVLHDIGKVAIPGSILCKPAALDDDERAQIQNHSLIGGRIVRMLHEFNLEPIVRHHHERFDGKGYPWGLKGTAIPLESRIILIADTFDAMTSDRPYRKAQPVETAFEELERCSGTQFDPDLVSVALEAGAQLEAARLEMQSQTSRDYFN